MKKIGIILIILAILLTAFFSGCVNVSNQLSIESFYANPTSINQGEYANLTWVVHGASSISIDNGIGNVTQTGNLIIHPTQTTTYILTAYNATSTKSSIAVITVNQEHQSPQEENPVTISDGINDVSSVDFNQKTTIITSHPEIDVRNIDIVEAIYHQDGTQVTLSLQVRGIIENRGRIIDAYSDDTFGPLNFVEYDFSLSTTEQDYTISYANQTGQISNGLETMNLTSSDHIVFGNTLTITFQLANAREVYENMSVTSMFVKMNFTASGEDFTDYVYLSDIAPNPALEIMETNGPPLGVVGDMIQFNASIIPLTGQPPYQYQWSFGDGGSSTQINPIHTYTIAGIFTYIFTVTDQAGNTASESGIITISQQTYENNPIALFDTNFGTFKIELFYDKMPLTVNNFVTLVNDGFYNGVIFHRIGDNFMIQTGGYYPNGTRKTSPYGNIPFETSDVKHVDGAISMASTGAKVGGSNEFFICDGAQSFLDGNYAAFGVVIEGMGVVQTIAAQPHADSGDGTGKPDTDIVINNILILTS